MTFCRCGYDLNSGQPHPCHRCTKPGEVRYYVQPGPPRWSLAGMQPKTVAHDTVACDSCWEAFKAELAKASAAYAKGEKPPVPKEWDGTMTLDELNQKE